MTNILQRKMRGGHSYEPVIGVIAGGVLICAAVAVRMQAKAATLRALNALPQGAPVGALLHHFTYMKLLSYGIGIAGVAVVLLALVAMARK